MDLIEKRDAQNDADARMVHAALSKDLELARLERDSAIQERDAAIRDRDSAVMERQRDIKEAVRKAIMGRDLALSELDDALDDARMERDAAIRDRDSAVMERQRDNKFKDEAENALKALSAIKKLCSAASKRKADELDEEIEVSHPKKAKLKEVPVAEITAEITAMLEAAKAKQSEKESQAQVQQDLAAAFPKKATKSASPPKRSSGYSLFPASSLNVDDEEEEDDSELCPDCPEPHLPGLPPGCK